MRIEKYIFKRSVENALSLLCAAVMYTVCSLICIVAVDESASNKLHIFFFIKFFGKNENILLLYKRIGREKQIPLLPDIFLYMCFLCF